MPVKAMDLFDAYQKSALPKDHGFVVSSFFSHQNAYSRYEIVSYANVKSIYPNDQGLTFQTEGKKLHILIEPPNYHLKSQEPYVRPSNEQVPHRFSELELLTCKNQVKAYWGKEPMNTFGSFTIMRPTGMNFSFVFYALPDIADTIELFFQKTLNKEAGMPQSDAKKVAKAVAEKVIATMGPNPQA